MKKIFIFVSIIFLFITSCQEALDVSPDGRTTIEEIFQNDANTAAYLNTCYANFQTWGLNDAVCNWRIADSDDSWANFADPIRIYKGGETAANPVHGTSAASGTWDNFWRNIRACNIFLSNIATASVNSETDRKRWTAEAKVLRAFYNMEMIKRWGGLPIITSPLGFDFDYTTLKRETFRACVDNVLKDCDEALAIPELPWRLISTDEDRRMTKAIASAIKSSAMLFAASDLWNEGQNYWAEAETITKKSLDDCLANGYELYRTILNPNVFQSAYSEYFCTKYDNSATPIDRETILIGQQTNLWPYRAGMPMWKNFASGCTPTQELVDQYDMQTSGLPVLKLDKPYLDEQHLQPNYNPGSGYDPTKPYVGRDPRFYATVWANGQKRIASNGKLTEIQTYQFGNNSIEPTNKRATATGYYSRKYDYPTSSSRTDALPTGYRYYRLGELYLNYAEAANENGHIPEAVAAINIIRTRAQMPPINPTNKEEARILIRHERRIEMAFEETRHFDVRRWEKPDGNLFETNRYLTGMWIVKTGNNLDYKRFVLGDNWDPTTNSWTNTGLPRECCYNKNLIWPIELGEARRLGASTGVNWQNPGW